MKKSFVSRCGIYYGACYIFCASRNGGEFLDYISKLTKTPKEQIRCNGCLGPEEELWKNCRECEARAWFEQGLYDAIKRGEYLNYKSICNYWVAARNKIYGNSVEWFPEMEAEWTMKPHYYRSDVRFYNYPYVYANCSSLFYTKHTLKKATDLCPSSRRSFHVAVAFRQ